jgi:hypothetical protein
MHRVSLRGTSHSLYVIAPQIPNNPLKQPSKLTIPQIGHQHGTAAKTQVTRCITFYASLFLKNCKQTWPQVLDHASQFEKQAKDTWPAYHEEMRGIADGAGVELLDIVALNVRTEINFGLFSDGCTSLAWKTEKHAFLGQNWDVRIFVLLCWVDGGEKGLMLMMRSG